MAEDTQDASAYSIDWIKTLGGALAAVTVAVLLSFLGAAGTLIGAALGSVAATVTTALYSQGLDRSRQAAQVVQSTALGKVGIAQTEVLRAVRRQDDGDDEAATAHLEHADEKLTEARDALDADPDGEADGGEPAATSGPDSLADRLRALGWKRIAIGAAGLFVVVMLLLTAVELVAGRSVSQITGGTSGDRGTSFGNLTGGSEDDEPSDTPSDRGTGPADDTSDEPTDDTSPTDDEQTDEPSDDPTEEPTDEETTPTTPTSPPTSAPATSSSPRG